MSANIPANRQLSVVLGGSCCAKPVRDPPYMTNKSYLLQTPLSTEKIDFSFYSAICTCMTPMPFVTLQYMVTSTQ